MEKGKITNCLVLHYKQYDFKKWFEHTINLLNNLNLRPTHIGIQGKGYAKIITKYETGYKNLLKKDFINVENIGIYVCEPNDDWVGFNWIDCFTIDFNRFIGFVCFWGIDENQSLNKKDMINIVKNYSMETIPLYGYEYQRFHEKYPYFYAMGMSSQKDTEEEKEALSKWIRGVKEIHIGKIRDIYEVNFLSGTALNMEVKEGITLNDYIFKNKKENLTKIFEELYVYEVSATDIPTLRKELSKMLLT